MREIFLLAKKSAACKKPGAGRPCTVFVGFFSFFIKSTTRTTKSFAFPISAAGQQEFFCVSLLTENVCENPRMDKFVTKCCRSSAVFPCRKLILALRSQTDGRVPRLRGKIKPGVAVCRACGAI